MPTLIKRARYPGRVEHFRALIERLNIQCENAWVSSGGETLVFRERRQLVCPTEAGAMGMPDEPEPEDVTPPTRGAWVVKPIDEWDKGRFRQAAIEAFEGLTGTLVQFWDAYVPQSRPSQVAPLGAAFEEFAQWVIDEAARMGDGCQEIVEEQTRRVDPPEHRPPWFPKQEKTKARWRRMWQLIVQRREEQRKGYDEWEYDDPELKLQDYADHVASEMKIRTPSTKWVSWVIRAGEAGWLD